MATSKAVAKKKTNTKTEVIPRAKKRIVAIAVDLEVMTPDRLKKMIFGFSNGTSKGVETWTIKFQFLTREKKTDKFGDPLVKLEVKVDSKNNALAEETATKGMNRAQVKHAITKTAPVAEKVSQKKAPSKLGERAVQKVVPARKQ